MIIALANTGTSDVILDDHHMRSAMFGDLAVSVPIEPSGEADADPGPQMIVQPGYGVFCATDSAGTPCNPRPHVSGLAVLRQHDLAAEFQRDDLRRVLEERAAESHEERLGAAAAWLGTPIARGEADGPSGFEYAVTYYDLGNNALGHGPAVPDDWFSGSRDRRFGFDAGGTSFALVRGAPELN